MTVFGKAGGELWEMDIPGVRRCVARADFSHGNSRKVAYRVFVCTRSMAITAEKIENSVSRFNEQQTRIHGGSSMESNLEPATLKSRSRGYHEAIDVPLLHSEYEDDEDGETRNRRMVCEQERLRRVWSEEVIIVSDVGNDSTDFAAG
ncbi:hypothetical protein AVEN_133755-1 [Araneus ventricosus]|uniref:Uncharacterized protein n=1 Tax=Araneus ventricosus TaxID=182803 RepID=A0A4Y2BAI6_ARAVE|nr:hypothetical protein AVEN_133755-1 [Araneus ventricosus]